MRLAITKISSDWPWLFGRVEFGGYAYSWVGTVDTFPCADVSVQSVVVELTGVDRSVWGGGRDTLPDPFQFVRQRYRLAYSKLHTKLDNCSLLKYKLTGRYTV